MDSGFLVRRREPEPSHDPYAKLVLGHSLVADVQDRSQDRPAQKADEQEIVEVTRLERGVLAVVGECEQLAFFGRICRCLSHSSIRGRSTRGASWRNFAPRQTNREASYAHAFPIAAG